MQTVVGYSFSSPEVNPHRVFNNKYLITGLSCSIDYSTYRLYKDILLYD